MPRNLNYHEAAVARARPFVSRLSFSTLVALAAAYVTGPLWPTVWLAAAVSTQALNHWAGAPLRRSPDLDLAPGREAFYLATVVLNAAAFGSGLGLSISRGPERLMGGDIAVPSVVVHGSTFTARLRLPEPIQLPQLNATLEQVLAQAEAGAADEAA